MRVEPLEPRRIRHPRGAYGWVDLRIVTEGHLARLGPQAALVYLFLCTVSNREGISFWSRIRMAELLALTPEDIQDALAALVAEDLIAATERVVQVLPLLEPRRDRQNLHPRGKTTQTVTISPVAEPSRTEPDVSDELARAHEAQARARIARFYGTREPSSGAVRALARALALKQRS